MYWWVDSGYLFDGGCVHTLLYVLGGFLQLSAGVSIYLYQQCTERNMGEMVCSYD